MAGFFLELLEKKENYFSNVFLKDSQAFLLRDSQAFLLRDSQAFMVTHNCLCYDSGEIGYKLKRMILSCNKGFGIALITPILTYFHNRFPQCEKQFTNWILFKKDNLSTG